MPYKLIFKEEALKEWYKLDKGVQTQFKKKLAERLQNPMIESARLNGLEDCYKIKLRNAGFRLVYQVRQAEIIVAVIAIGKRERNAVYKAAIKRV